MASSTFRPVAMRKVPSNKKFGISSTSKQELLSYIEDGIDCTRDCFQENINPRATRGFHIKVTAQSNMALIILRLAARNGISALVWQKPLLECCELGVQPPPVPLG